MKKIIYALIFLICLSSVSAEVNYFFEVKYDLENGRMELNDLDLIDGGEVYSDSEFATHDIRLFSFDDEVLYNFSYSWNSIASYDFYPLDENTVPPEKLSYDLLQLNMPFYRTGKEIRVTDLATRQTLTIDVSKYASCNEDSICDVGEDERTCPKDCRIDMFAESVGQQVVEQKEESITEEKVEEKKSLMPYFIVGILVGIILAIILIILRQKRKVYK